MKKRDTLAWALVIIGSACTALVPFIFYKSVTGSFLPEILPQLETDSLYYLAQVKEILDGRPFLGNPFFIEHADLRFPGLLLPIWIAALPGFLGFTPNLLFAFNAFFYSTLTGALLYMACLRFSQRNRLVSGITAVLGTASVHNLLIRPAIMQVIYPAFLLCILSLYGVLRKPNEPIRYVLLAVTATLGFYLYPYLWMINFTAIGLLTLYFLIQKHWLPLRYIALMWIGVLVLCIPQIITMISLVHDPLASALSYRVELVDTHRVLPETLLNNKYTILSVVTLLIFWFRRKLQVPELVVLFLSSGLIIASVSNVITGKEIDFNTHFWRLGLLLTVIAIPVFYRSFFEARKGFIRVVAGIMTILLVLTTVSRVFIRLNGYHYLRKQTAILQTHESTKEFVRVFDYLNAVSDKQNVILAPYTMGMHILIHTDDYLFYMQRGALHLVPEDELLERFLVYNIDRVDAQFLEDELDGYKGGGVLHAAIYASLFGEEVRPMDLIGGEEFIEETLAKHSVLQNTYDGMLQKYQVRYVITDTEAPYNPRVPEGTTQVYADDRFTIYELSNEV